MDNAKIVWLVCLIAFTSISVHGQTIEDAVLDKLCRSVVKVYARHKDEKVATGFVYGRPDMVVTALHVVSGASKIQVKLSDNGPLITAVVIRAVKDYDLALLKLDQSTDRPVLVSGGTVLRIGDELFCVGYPLNIPKPDPTFLRIKSNTSRLRDIIPAQIKEDLDKFGFPNTDGTILSLDGHLLPGHSGAPIFNSDGQIVAISDGGLAVGGASRSWAIPAIRLSGLMNSGESVPNISVMENALFAEELSSQTPNIAISDDNSDEEIIFIRRASYYDMLSTTDDPMGLSQISATFGNLDYTNIFYKIYRERNTGASLVIPDNAGPPTYENGIWYVASDNNTFQLFFQIESELDSYQVQQYSSQFETDIVQYDDMQYWMFNQQWSYPFLRPTLSGMVVRRKAFQKFVGGYQQKQMIITFSALNGVLLSSAAKLNNQNILYQPSGNIQWFWFATSAFLTTLAN